MGKPKKALIGEWAIIRGDGSTFNIKYDGPQEEILIKGQVPTRISHAEEVPQRNDAFKV